MQSDGAILGSVAAEPNSPAAGLALLPPAHFLQGLSFIKPQLQAVIRAVSTSFHGQGGPTWLLAFTWEAGPGAPPHVSHFGFLSAAEATLLTLSISEPRAQQAYAAVPAYCRVFPFLAHENAELLFGLLFLIARSFRFGAERKC